MASCSKLGHRIFEKLPFDVVDCKNNEIPKVNIYTCKGFVFVGPKRYILPDRYKKTGLDIYNFEARPDDVYVVGCIRSGTTLHCEMIWQIANNLDYEGAARDFLDYRFPHIDFDILGRLNQVKDIVEKGNLTNEGIDIANKYLEMTVEGLAKRKGRRFIKSHLPLSIMPPHIFEIGAKVIYCARNPKDMLASIASVTSFLTVTQSAGIRDCFDDFKNDLGSNSPYFEHVKEGWERRNDKNFLFLFYEDTIKNKRQAIHKIADFLGKKLSKEQIESLENYLRIENFRKNKSVNCDQLAKIGLANKEGFFIEGKTGSSKNFFDKEVSKEFDQLIKEKLKGTDLRFPQI